MLCGYTTFFLQAARGKLSPILDGNGVPIIDGNDFESGDDCAQIERAKNPSTTDTSAPESDCLSQGGALFEEFSAETIYTLNTSRKEEAIKTKIIQSFSE